MKVEFTRGGSGTWKAVVDGLQIGNGHVPKRVKDPEPIMRRQLIRQAQEGLQPKILLGGGSIRDIEVPDEYVQTLLSAAKERHERKMALPSAWNATLQAKEILPEGGYTRDLGNMITVYDSRNRVVVEIKHR